MQLIGVSRAGVQSLSSILKAMRRFQQRNASTLFVTTFAVTLVSTTIAWIWMLIGTTKWTLGF
jgi:hypothetical protein